MRHHRHNEGRNPRRSPYKNDQGTCGSCGRHTQKFKLILQRGVFVARDHPGCVDNPNTYQGPLQRGPHYGGS